MNQSERRSTCSIVSMDTIGLLREAIEATENRNETKVMILLECVERKNTKFSLDQKLRRSTVPSNVFLAKLRDLSIVPRGYSPETATSFSLLKSLLVVPIHYETPWICVCDFVASYCHPTHDFDTEFRKSWILTCITEIQIFLQRAARVLCKNKRGGVQEEKQRMPDEDPSEDLTHQTARLAILRLAHILANRFVMSHDNTTIDRDICLDFGLELTPSLLSFGRDVDESLYRSLIDVFLRNNISSKHLSSWLRFVTKLDNFQIEVGGAVKQALLSPQGILTQISLHQLPAISREVITIAASTLRSSDNDKEVFRPWQRIIMRILYRASEDVKIYDAVEIELHSKLAAFSAPTMDAWIGSLELQCDDNLISQWVHINLISATMRSIHLSWNQLSLNSQSSGSQITRQIQTSRCHKLALDRIVPASYENACRRLLKGKSWIDPGDNDLQSIFDGISFNEEGDFKVQNDTVGPVLSAAGSVLRECMFVGNGMQLLTNDKWNAADRAEFWINMAMSATERPPTWQESFFSVIVPTIAYMSVPKCRTGLVRRMIHSLSSSFISPQRKAHFCAVICIITRSDSAIVDSFDIISELEWSAMFSFPSVLPTHLFFQLADCLSVLAPVRKSILSASVSFLE